jgi:hypothetical protein
MSRTQHPIDLIEEAVYLLRRAPIETYALFLVGIAPFVLCFFQFCSEMSYSAFAGNNLPGFASTLALSYLWMKVFQHLACRQLVAAYTSEPPAKGNLGRILRSCVHQAAIHPVGLLVKPMAAIASIPGFITFVPLLMLPASVTSSFFQNASILITGERGDFEKCWHLSVNRVRATPSLLFLTLFLRIVIFLNVYITIAILPYLLKALFGVDTFLSRHFRWLISFSYFVGIALISYFAVDLLIKAIRVIQVCRAEAQTTGKDLRRSLVSLTTAKSLSLMLVCLIIPAVTAHGRSPAVLRGGSAYEIVLASVKRTSPPSEADRIPDSELNERIDRELSGSEYSWRKPQQHLTSVENNWPQRFGAWMTKTLGKISRAISRIVDGITKWWKSLFPDSGGSNPFSASSSAPSWISQLLLYAIVCGLVMAATLIVLRVLGRSKKTKPPPVGPQIAVIPNLESETTVADELPEDQWVLLARRKMAEGEPRLALRALFLAVLSLLGAQRLIIVRRSKSNFDYETELKRRRSAEVTELFRGNRRLFERCWYGDHPVTDIEIEQSNSFYQRLKHACLAEK